MNVKVMQSLIVLVSVKVMQSLIVMVSVVAKVLLMSAVSVEAQGFLRVHVIAMEHYQRKILIVKVIV